MESSKDQEEIKGKMEKLELTKTKLESYKKNIPSGICSDHHLFLPVVGQYVEMLGDKCCKFLWVLQVLAFE